MHGFGNRFATGLAALALGMCAASGQEAEPRADVAEGTAESPAAVAEAAVAEAGHEALEALPERVRGSLSPEALRRAVLEAVLRAGDPGVSFPDGGEVEGAGIRWHSGMLLTGSEGLPRVSFVAEGSPAAEARIAAGDRLAEIGGTAVAEGGDLSSVRAALRGGEEAALAVKTIPADGGEGRTVELVRCAPGRGGLAAAERLPTGIGYLWLESVRPGMAEEIGQTLEAWMEESPAIAGVVLDLRGADGAADAENEIRGICSLFALPGKILYRVDEGTSGARTVAAGALGERCRLPLMVLADEGTTGAAELLAAALAGGGDGVLVIGRTTSGDPLVREDVTLADGSRVHLAVHAVTVADGRCYDGRAGVEPALEIGPRALAENVYEPEEPVLRKGKSLSEEEKEDRALRDRTRFDPYLRRAADVLLGLQAIGHEWR